MLRDLEKIKILLTEFLDFSKVEALRRRLSELVSGGPGR
jgi:hypothetical protein